MIIPNVLGSLTPERIIQQQDFWALLRSLVSGLSPIRCVYIIYGYELYMIYNYDITGIYHLVGGIPTPLQNMTNRQLGLWHSKLNGKHKIPWFQTTNQVRNMTQNVPNHQSEFPISSPSLALNSAPGHRSAPAFMDATINHKGRWSASGRPFLGWAATRNPTKKRVVNDGKWMLYMCDSGAIILDLGLGMVQ
jgi:hypothetical protein